MAKAKKAKKAKKAAFPYIRRVAEDRRVHQHLRDAATGIRQAYGRASSKRGKAAEDKKLYGHLREAATSLRRATLAVREPEPKHRGRQVLLVALAGGGAALIVKRVRREKIEAEFSNGSYAADEGGSPSVSDAQEQKAATAG
jgi:hypothetical protein